MINTVFAEIPPAQTIVLSPASINKTIESGPSYLISSVHCVYKTLSFQYGSIVKQFLLDRHVMLVPIIHREEENLFNTKVFFKFKLFLQSISSHNWILHRGNNRNQSCNANYLTKMYVDFMHFSPNFKDWKLDYNIYTVFVRLNSFKLCLLIHRLLIMATNATFEEISLANRLLSYPIKCSVSMLFLEISRI